MRFCFWGKEVICYLFKRIYTNIKERRGIGNYQPSQAQDCVCIFTWWLLGGELGYLRLESTLLCSYKISIQMPNKLLLKIEWSTHSSIMYQLEGCLHHWLTLIYWTLACCCVVWEDTYIQIYRLTSCAQMEFTE